MRIIVAVISVFVALYIAYFFYALTPASNDSMPLRVAVAKGQGFREIADILKEKGIIRSDKAFKMYSVLSGNARNQKAILR